MTLDLERIRLDSTLIAGRLGYKANRALPLLEVRAIERSVDDTVDRLFAMHCAAACAFGCDCSKALSWYQREVAHDCLTRYEKLLLSGNDASLSACKVQVEAIWALCWSLCLTKRDLDFERYCPNTLVKLLPDILVDESGETLRKRARFQEVAAITAKLDLAYCLHWCIVDAALNGRDPGIMADYVIIERRRALEWLFSKEHWENVALDT